MKNKKNILLVALILIVSIVFTGCNGDSSIDEAQLILDANATVDKLFKGMENSSLSTIDGTLSSDFTHTNGSSQDKQELLDMLSSEFSVGAGFTEVDLINRVNEVISFTEITISGSLYIESYDGDGVDYTHTSPVQFIVKKESNGWEITKWIEE